MWLFYISGISLTFTKTLTDLATVIIHSSTFAYYSSCWWLAYPCMNGQWPDSHRADTETCSTASGQMGGSRKATILCCQPKDTLSKWMLYNVVLLHSVFWKYYMCGSTVLQDTVHNVICPRSGSSFATEKMKKWRNVSRNELKAKYQGQQHSLVRI